MRVNEHAPASSIERFAGRGLLAALIGLATAGAPALGANITNGALNVNIRSDNGAINDLQFNGQEFYRLGSFVSDYGFQVGTDTSTFVRNTAYGGGVTTSLTGDVATGKYTGGGSDVDFSRGYSIVSGLNVLKITTTLTNNGSSDVDLRYFDTYDPDQGNSYPSYSSATSNDVLTMGGLPVAQSTVASGLTVVWGTTSPLGFTSGTLGIMSGGQLNSLFTSPFDPNGTTADIGVGIGFQLHLAAGASQTVTLYHAYGATVADAQAAFEAATVVPEPSSLLTAAIGALTGGACWLRRRRLAVA